MPTRARLRQGKFLLEPVGLAQSLSLRVQHGAAVAAGIGVEIHAARGQAAVLEDHQHALRRQVDVGRELIGVPAEEFVAGIGIDRTEPAGRGGLRRIALPEEEPGEFVVGEPEVAAAHAARLNRRRPVGGPAFGYSTDSCDAEYSCVDRARGECGGSGRHVYS